MNDSKKHILNVSTKLFLQHSYKEVTMKALVEESGLSKGAFYHYFDNKEQLFVEVVDHLLANLLDSHFTKLNKETLHAFYHDYINYFINSLSKNEVGDSSNYFSLIFDALKLIPNLTPKLMQLQQVSQSIWVKVIQNAKETGEIKSSMADEQIAQIFTFSADGIGLNNIFMMEHIDDTKERLIVLWDSFYQQLR